MGGKQMLNFLKILSIVAIFTLLISYSTSCLAINMTLDSTTSNEASVGSTNDDSNNTNTLASDIEISNTSNSSNSKRPSYSTQITISTQELTLSNALSICFIAIGIVLILLSIANLIKLKK